MKKLFVLMLVLICTFDAFAKGEKEDGKKEDGDYTTITILGNGIGTVSPMFGESAVDVATRLIRDEFPNVAITNYQIDLSDGSTLTMDAMLAAGTAPNIYVDTTVRTSKYMVPEYALPLDEYVTDLDKYSPSALNANRGPDGKLYALPQHGGAQGMCINLDLMADIGYEVPENWTIDDFLEMAELVKQKYDGKKWATGMFAANQSGDYLINNWFASFGVDFYQNGNYDKSTIADTGGAKVYEFFQMLNEKGYIPPNSESLNDDDYCVQWQKGDLAATAFFPGWAPVYLKAGRDNGYIEKDFAYKFVPFPRASNVDKVPTYYSGAVFIVHKTGNEKVDAIAARFAQYLNGQLVQERAVKESAVVSTRTDVTPSTDPYIAQIAKILDENGLQDVGLNDPRFTIRRGLHYPILQKVLTSKLTPEEAIKLYQDKLSEVKK